MGKGQGLLVPLFVGRGWVDVGGGGVEDAYHGQAVAQTVVVRRQDLVEDGDQLLLLPPVHSRVISQPFALGPVWT